MTLTLVQLETFARLADVGNFTRVAEELHLTQPAVTQQVRTLERQVGVRLVDIVGRRPVLTDGGRFLAARAREILAGASALEREMREFAQVEAGELHLGASRTVGAYVLPQFLARFASDYPRVALRVEIGNTVTIAGRVAEGTLNVALIEGPLDDERFAVRRVRDDRLLLAVSPDHPLATRVPVRLRDLAGQPFIWREPGSGTRSLVETVLRAHGVEVRPVLELPSGEGIVHAVETGLGVSILSELVVEDAVARRKVAAVAIADVDLTRTFRLIFLRDRTLSPAARAFSGFL